SPLFRHWLLQHYPDRYRHVMSLVRSMRIGISTKPPCFRAPSSIPADGPDRHHPSGPVPGRRPDPVERTGAVPLDAGTVLRRAVDHMRGKAVIRK
ncbi:hypothetical protein AB9E19_33470, partial [Rhizobium leguminosarum]|uniref:hypothetical protein n=1 Tax=Rhizobium leguminosarum TaxID=384 RepID=UPI003F98D835